MVFSDDLCTDLIAGILLPKRLAKAEKVAKESQRKLSELFINSPGQKMYYDYHSYNVYWCYMYITHNIILIKAVDFGEKEILAWLDSEQRAHHASEGLMLVCDDHSSNNYHIFVIRFQSKNESF